MDTQDLEALINECKDEEENCRYTSVSLLIWLRWLRAVRCVLIGAGVLLGGAAGTQAFSDSFPMWAGILASIAGIIPLVMSALKVEESIENVRLVSGRFTALRDRFRRAANVWAASWSYEAFEAECRKLFEEAEALKQESVTAPEWAFRKARKKIKAGHYTPDSAVSATPPKAGAGRA